MTSKQSTDAEIAAYTVGELKPHNAPINIVDYDPAWPGLFEREGRRVRDALCDLIVQLEHVGSTSVPGLAAKPQIDILLVLPDSSHASSTGSAGIRQLELAAIKPEDLDEPQSLGKGWHGAHFLLARTTYEPTTPPGDAVLGGTEIGQDLGYGPLRVMTVAEAARTARALLQVDLAALAKDTSSTELESAQIYPGGWGSHDSLHWLVDCVRKLTDYYQAPATRERAMLLFIS